MSINDMMKESQRKLEEKEKEELGACLVHFTRVWKHLGFTDDEIIYYSGYYIKMCQELN